MVHTLQETALEDPSVVTTLAETLERLGARIQRDLNVDAGEVAAPDDQWTETLTDFVGFAEECLAVLDDPRVSKALAVMDTYERS